MILELLKLVSILRPKTINTDYFTSKLVHTYLFCFLAGCSMHAVYLTYHDHPLRCHQNAQIDLDKETLSSYCWNHGVFIYPKPTQYELENAKLYIQKDAGGSLFAHQNTFTEYHPGVRPRTEPESERIYHTFSKYIGIFFIVSACSCFAGKLFFDQLQKPVVTDLLGLVIKKDLSEEELDREIEAISKKFVENRSSHTVLENQFMGFQVLGNLVVTGAQLWVLVEHFCASFRVFGLALYVPYEKWPFDLITLFPVTLICEYTKSSMTGDKRTYVALCDLPNGYTFQVMLAVHMVCVGFCLITSMISAMLFCLHVFVPYYRLWSLRKTLGKSTTRNAEKAIRRLSSGSCFIVEIMLKNLPKNTVVKILEDSLYRLEGKQLDV